MKHPFLTLTKLDGSKILINMAHIESVEKKRMQGHEEDVTVLVSTDYANGGAWYPVKESLDEIEDMLFWNN